MEFTFSLQRFSGEVSTWRGNVGTVPAAVNGVITITTAEQLAALAKNVNEVNSNSDITYQLADGSIYSANPAQSIWLAK